MATANTFEFIGEARFGKEIIKLQEFNSGWNKRTLQMSVVESNNNSAYVSMEHGFYEGQNRDIHTFSKSIFGEKGSKLVIDWSERLDDDSVRNVAEFKKIVIDKTIDQDLKNKYYNLRSDIYNLESKEEPSQSDKEKLLDLYEKVKELVPERKEFISQEDALNYIESIADELKGKKVKVKGEIKTSYWDGKFFTNYEVKSIELVPEEYKNKLSGQVELYFEKSSMDESLFKKERKILFDTFVREYSNDHKADVFYPFNTVFNAQKHDDENKNHVAHIDIIKDSFTVKNKKYVYKQPFEIRFVNGSETKEGTIDDLTQKQKNLVNAGLAEVSDYIKSSFGDKVVENRIYLPIMKDLGYNGNFSDGAIETEIETDDLVYVPVKKEVKENKNTTTFEKENVNKARIIIDEDQLPF